MNPKNSRKSDVKNTLFTEVTDKIITALESGTTPWRRAWQTGHEGLPVSAVTGQHYRGINVMLLWTEAVNKGYESNRWLTFHHAFSAGGIVRRGEKATQVILFKPFKKPEPYGPVRGKTDETGEPPAFQYHMMARFHLFNTDQCDNLPGILRYRPSEPLPEPERHTLADKLVTASGVPVEHRHQRRACYFPGMDRILMPLAAQFQTPEDYYSTLLHELVHSTGHATRLAREGIVATSGNKSDPRYGFEELVAEMGSAFLCAKLGIQGDLQHESYIASWLSMLRADNKAVFRAARYAREAFEYLTIPRYTPHSQ